MKHAIVTLIATICFYTVAHARYDVRSYDEWAADILKRLPFVNGELTASSYAKFGKGYFESMVRYHGQMTERKVAAARKAGRHRFADMLEHQYERQIERLETYVSDNERGVLKSLDPLGTGKIRMQDARRTLFALAQFADFNRNGVLERIEAEFAEAAFVRGIDLADQAQMSKLMSDLERDQSWQQWAN